MKRPLSRFRPFGPFIQYNASSFTSDQDARDINEAITRDTPAIMLESEYMGFFDDPSLNVEFRIPSENDFTRTREHVSSALSVDAESRRIREATIRFPEVNSTLADLDALNKFMAEIVPEPYRARMDTYTPNAMKFYYPHVHYSTTRRREQGPLVGTQVMKLNKMVKDWYEGVSKVKA